MDQYKNQILDQQKLYYNSYLKVKDNPRYKKARKFILDNSYGNERILDIGCADGDFSACLVEKGFDCYGLEIMEDGIRKAREKKIKIIDGSFLDKFPFPDNHFDFVFAGEVIEHTFDDFFFLEEIYRILKPGGVLILTTPNLVSLGNRLLMLFGKLPRFAYNEFHYRIYNLNLVISKMRQVNFQIIGYNSSYVLISSLFNKFIGMVGEWLGSLVPKLGEHLIIYAKKPIQYFFNEAGYANNNKDENLVKYKKYIERIKDCLRRTQINCGSSFLDIGCGVGNVVDIIAEDLSVKACGLDVGVKSIEIAKRNKRGEFFVYNGGKLPFSDKYFDVVSSFNVLEHTDNPLLFLEEQFRVIKDGGYLLIVCPNFLSITNNFHYHTRGVVQKVKNLFGIFKRLILKNVNFSKMKVITRKDFQPDDDACNVTNPIEILNWAEKKKLKLRYWSSQSIYKDGLVNYLDFSFIKFFFGSSFFVFKKYDTQK